MAEGTTRQMIETWIHEFGHHLDYTIFRANTVLFRNKKLSFAAERQMLEVRTAYAGMIKEYRSVSKTVAKKLGLRIRGVMSERQQINNWGRIEREMEGLAQTSYSLHNDKEWIAELTAAYFNQRGTRDFMRQHQPATYNFFQTLFSKEMEILWSEL